MSPVRSFLSVMAVLVGALGAAGCYDLSDPSGPHREDFVQSEPPAQPSPDAQDPGQREVQAETVTTDVLEEQPRMPKSATAEEERAEEARKLRIVP